MSNTETGILNTYHCKRLGNHAPAASLAEAKNSFGCASCAEAKLSKGKCYGPKMLDDDEPVASVKQAVKPDEPTPEPEPDGKDEKIVAFFTRLANIMNKGRRLDKGKQFVEKYFKEMSAARRQGHSFKAISTGLADLGVSISTSTLAVNFKKIAGSSADGVRADAPPPELGDR